MTVLGVVLLLLRGLGMVLLVLLALLVLFLLLPVTLHLDWTPAALTVRLRVLFFKISLYPFPSPKEKKQRPHKEKNHEKHPPEKQQPTEPQKQDGGMAGKLKTYFQDDPLGKIRHILTHAGAAGRMIFRGLHFRHIVIYWTVTGWDNDAADTALTYGRTMGLCSGVWTLARELLDLRADTLYLEPDYTGEMRKKRHLACQIHTQPCILLAAGIYLLVTVWKDPALHLGHHKI